MRTAWTIASLSMSLAFLVVFGLLIAGGIRYQAAVEFVADQNAGDSLPSVHIQSRRVAGWGNIDVLGYSSYGAPFAVFVSGSLPLDASATSASVRNIYIEADGKQVFSGEEADLDLGDTLVYEINSQQKGKGFGFLPVASLPTTPLKFRVCGQLILRSPTGSEMIPFDRSFSLHQTRRFSIGTSSWNI
jgi:hypothetical protein